LPTISNAENNYYGSDYHGGCHSCWDGGAVAAGAAGITYAMGVHNHGALPAGAKMINTNGNTYYVSGSTWFQPAYGATGVYYRVVPVP